MTYAIINPVILPLGLAYFITAWIVWKHCILFVYEHSHESGGGQFETLFRNIMSTLYLTVFFSGIVLISRGAWDCGGVVIVLFPIMLWQFQRVVVYFKPENNYPLEEVARVSFPSRDLLIRVFTDLLPNDHRLPLPRSTHCSISPLA